MIIYDIFYHDVCLSSWFWRYVQLTMQTALSKCWQQLCFWGFVWSLQVFCWWMVSFCKKWVEVVLVKNQTVGRSAAWLSRPTSATCQPSRPQQRRRALPVQRRSAKRSQERRAVSRRFFHGDGPLRRHVAVGPATQRLLIAGWYWRKSNFPGKSGKNVYNPREKIRVFLSPLVLWSLLVNSKVSLYRPYKLTPK